jgi:hypothetical protein
MAHIEADDDGVMAARENARLSGHMHNARTMLFAAGLSAFGIVAVATAMLTAIL